MNKWLKYVMVLLLFLVVNISVFYLVGLGQLLYSIHLGWKDSSRYRSIASLMFWGYFITSFTVGYLICKYRKSKFILIVFLCTFFCFFFVTRYFSDNFWFWIYVTNNVTGDEIGASIKDCARVPRWSDWKTRWRID